MKKKYYVIGAIVCLIIVIIYIFYRSKKNEFLEDGLQETVAKKTNYLYKVSYDSIWVNEAAGDLYIKNLRIKGDLQRQKQWMNTGDTNAVKMLADVIVPQLKVEDFATAKALLSKKLVCKSVVITNPSVQIMVFPGIGNKRSQQNNKELYEQILGDLNLIQADSILVQNAQVDVEDYFSKEKKFIASNTTVNLINVAIDSSYSYDSTRVFFSKQIKIKTEHIQLGKDKNGVSITNAAFDTKTGKLLLQKIDYDDYKNEGFFKTTLNDIVLTGIDIQGPVDKTSLVVDNVVVTSGELETKGQKKGNSSSKNRRLLSGYLKELQVKRFNAKAINFTQVSNTPDKQSVVINNNSFTISNIAIDTTTTLGKNLLSSGSDIIVRNNEINFYSGDKMYRYRAKGLTVSTARKSLHLEGLYIIPLLNEPDFTKKLKVQGDRFNLDISNINCYGIDMQKLVDGSIDINKVLLSHLSLRVFRDLNYPIDSVSKRAQSNTYPHQLLHTLNVPLRINELAIPSAYIEYKEKNNKSKRSGQVVFANSSINIKNINNGKHTSGEKAIVRFSTSFLHKIPLKGSFIFYLNEWKSGKFSVEAESNTTFNATIFNQLTKPMSLAEIKDGTIKRIQFNFTADTANSTGKLKLIYAGLKINLLKQKENEYRKRDVFSFLANLAVKNENKPGKDSRVGTVEITPDTYKSFFNYIWLSIFSGLKDIIVIDI